MLYFLTYIGILVGSYAIQLGYPLYMTYQSVQEKKNTIQWLAYWAIYSVFMILENIVGSLDQ